jgi:hypothetical protein
MTAPETLSETHHRLFSAHPRFHWGHWLVSDPENAIFCKLKEINELRGGVLVYVAQAIPPIDAEIAEKGHLWTETI